jgi:hypothetical protein
MRYPGVVLLTRTVAVAALLIAAQGMVQVAPARAETDAHSVVLAPHRAIYDLKLKSLRNTRALENVSGRMLYDFSGNTCEGYTLTVRQASALDSGEEKSAVSDQTTSTYEDGHGGSFRFTSRNRRNDEDVANIDGNADNAGGKVTVSLTKPAPKSFDAGAGVVFPTDQMRRVIAAARDGKTFLQMPLYDGSDDGLKVFDTTTIIGQPIKPSERVPTDAAAGKSELKGLTRWPVTISYFERNKKEGEKTPAYALSFELYDNGISRALTIDYNDFVLSGELSALDIKAADACK